MDDSEKSSHNVNTINLVENVAACPDDSPIGKIQIIRVVKTIRV